MAANPNSNNTPGINDSGDSGEKDPTIAELREQISVLEAALREYREDFKAQVQERTRELSESEEALRQSKVDLAMAQEIAHVGSWVWDLETNDLTWSDELYRMLGMEPRSVKPSADLYLDFVHPDDKKREQTNIEYGKTKGNNVSEVRLVQKNGTIIDTEVVTRPIYRDGKLVRIYGTVQDITECKRAEEGLRLSEEKYRTLFETMDEGFALCELVRDSRGEVIDYRVLEANRAFEKHAGFAPAEVAGRLRTEVNPIRDESFLEACVRVVETGKPIQLEQNNVGLGRWLRVGLFPHNDDRFTELFDDITERKQAEIALRESEFRFRQLVESLPLLVWTCLADGSCDYVSPQWVNYTGIPEELQLGQGWLKQVHPNDRKRVAKEWHLNAADGKQYDIEYRLRRYDGVYRWFKVRGIPIYDLTGNLIKWFGSNTDIDDMKQAMDALRVSERNLSRAQSIARLGFWVWEVDEDVLIWSDETYRLFGLQPGEMKPNYEIFLRFVHPGDRERVAKAVKDALEGIRGYNIEWRHLNEDGSLSHFYSQGEVERVNGRPSRMMGTILDITQRKQAEETLRESQMLLHAITEGSADPIFVKDRQSRIIFGNSALLHVLDKPMEELIGKTDREFYDDPAIAKATIANDRRVLESGKNQVIEEVVQTIYGVRTYLSTKTPYRNSKGEIIGIIGIAHDITERKRTEDALRETRDYLESLINYANAPIIVWNPEFTITQFNHAFERLSGYKAEEVVGQSLNILFPPDSVEESLAKIRSTLTGERWESVEIPILRKDGSTRIALWNSANIQDEKGKLQATIAQGQDITERKRAEKDLEEAKAQAELYLDLMGHDINNMNQSAQGYLELALQTLEMDGKIGINSKVLIEKPLQAVQSSSRLISNVRKLQRLADEDVNTRPIDLQDLFEALKSLDFHVGNRDANIKIHEVPHGLVEGSDLLIDVFFNLISNAVKHSGQDTSVTINVTAERVEQGSRAYYRCTVEDDGPGIADDLKHRLFHRFQRGKTQAHGKGLGLYLVRTLVEGYHGKVWVDDRVPGDHRKGAKFVVMLPAVE